MDQVLLEEDQQKEVGYTQNKVFIFANEIQFFVSNHNILNQVISFIIYLLLIAYNFLSALPISPLDNPEMELIDYAYMIFTGTISNPSKSSIVIISILLNTIVLFLLGITFIVSMYLLVTPVHLPFAIKVVAVLWYYVIPLFTPIELVVLSRTYNYLSITDDNLLFLFFLFTNIFIYAMILIVGVFNAVTIYRVKYIFSTLKPFQAIAFTFLLAVSHQMISFVSYPSQALLVVSFFIQLAGIIYFTYQTPYITIWMTTALLTYYIFSLCVSILRVLPIVVEFWEIFIVLGASLMISIVLSFSFKSHILCKIGLLKNRFDRTRFDINQKIVSVDLRSLQNIEIWALLKIFPELSRKLQDLLFKILDSRDPKTFEDSLFLYTFEIVLNYNDDKIYISKNQIYALKSLKTKFWEAVWKVNFSVLPQISAEIGHRRVILQQNILFYNNYNRRSHKTVKKLTSPGKIQKNHHLTILHILVILFCAASVLSQYFISISFRSSYSKFVKFTKLRNFLTSISLIQIDLWPKNNFLSKNTYDIVIDNWEKIKNEDILTLDLNEIPYISIIQTYLNDLSNYNTTLELTDALTSLDIFHIFHNLFLKSNGHFDRINYRTNSDIESALFSVLAIISFFYIIGFIGSILRLSNQEHSFFAGFQSFSKNSIINYRKIEIKNEINVPVPLHTIEWDVLKYFIISYLTSFVAMFFLWLIVYLEFYFLKEDSKRFSNYTDLTGSFALAYGYYSVSVFYGKRSFFQPKVMEAIDISDDYFNQLYIDNESSTLIKIIPKSIFKNIASFYYQTPLKESDNSIKETIRQLYKDADLLDTPIFQYDCDFIVRVVVFLISTIFLTIVAYFSHYVFHIIHDSSISEKIGLLIDFENEANIENWKLDKYNSDDLPLILLKMSSDLTIKFATKCAKEKLNIDVGNNFTDIKNYDLIHSSEILNAIHDMKNTNSSNSITIKKDNGKFTIINPHFQIISCIKTLKSIILIDDVELVDKDDDLSIYESVNPYFKVGSPKSIAFKNDQIALISLKLIGLSNFVKINSPQIVKSYLTDILSQLSEIDDFYRISIRNNTIIVASKNIVFSTNNQFISVCADFGKKAQNIVSSLSKQYETDVFCSVLFHRCEAMTLNVNDVQCGQSDFTSNVINFIDECHSHFLMNAIGFVPRMKITQILNMSKIMTITLKNGATADIFIFI
ncbi:hypothetical protein TRFO_19689 [Tritrichomonas foetus]|uniref:Guanylate cyclase domain-containing protein n=1 Tax=Tritrichomonas foetus TaxID=1144522 RepID=A0A1J4KNC3_9EUKA|nr:hypothetical protein TRFO_19689 [Tritrichomonas foetus]|eukprot:OHT10893.1 hypothetical protein TRFO_19689 [Tritrichomonas foetus]